jgi:hypothetical protein
MFRRKKRDVVVDGDISVDDLRRIVQQLDARQPITDEYEARTAHLGRNANGDQKSHLDGWLSEYNGPGAYDRRNPSNSGLVLQPATVRSWAPLVGGSPR